MVLSRYKKKILKDIVKYYVETTGNLYEEFIMAIQKNRAKVTEDMDYAEWLAIKSFDILVENGVKLIDCIENKDIIRSAIKEDESRRDGEFYTPERWAVEGRKYLQRLLGDKWGKAYIWDASCYSMDTEILTRRGWVFYDELKDDDLIYALNPETMRGEFVGYHDKFKKYVNDSLFRIKNLWVDLLVTKDHSMFVKESNEGYDFFTAGDIFSRLTKRNNLCSLRTAAKFVGVDSKCANGDKLFWSLMGFFIMKEKNGFIKEFNRSDTSESEFIFWLLENTDSRHYKDILKGMLGKSGDIQKIDYTSENKEHISYLEFLMHLMGYSVVVTNDGKKYSVKGTLDHEVYLDESCMSMEKYVGYVWDITLDKYHVFKVRRNGVSVFCGNCGTGNLLTTVEYPRNKLFLSTLLPEDIDMVDKVLSGANTFVCDFVNGIDSVYEDLIRGFSSKLPDKLLQVLENDEDLIIFMNPPFKVMEPDSSDVGSYMASLGMRKCSLDIFNQFLYRICMIKRKYNLKNLYLGLYGPITIFHSKMLEDLYNEFKSDFVFEGGMCFDAGDFSDTSESVAWITGYTTWRTKKAGDKDRSILLDAKVSDDKGNISVIGERLVANVEENLHNWSFPDPNIMHATVMPEVSNLYNFTGRYNKFAKNAMGSMMSSTFVIRATRRACLTSLPNVDGVDITEDNFWRCVASYGARRSYAIRQNPYNNCQYYSKPDISIEGYNEWVVDALALFLFDSRNEFGSYRDIQVDGSVVGSKLLNVQNKFFPIDCEVIRGIVTDDIIIQDLEKFPPKNQFILSLLCKLQDRFGPEAYNLYKFGLNILLESLQGDIRKKEGYLLWTQAWDAGFMQVRGLKEFFSKKVADEYFYLNVKLRDRLVEGVYKYGFMMDTNMSYKDNIK